MPQIVTKWNSLLAPTGAYTGYKVCRVKIHIKITEITKVGRIREIFVKKKVFFLFTQFGSRKRPKNPPVTFSGCQGVFLIFWKNFSKSRFFKLSSSNLTFGLKMG